MFTRSRLMKFCTSVLIKLRMDEEKANDTSDILIEADLMGHSTHGVRLLPLYIKDIEAGNMIVTGQEEIIKDTGGCLTIDGKNLPVAPFGGTKALLTPDPMALAFPTNNEPVIIDISASITTNNMIADKISKNELFDFNCLLTSDGIPTNDPKEVFEKNGTVMPVGGLEYGHKGFGLALGIEALSQGLSGSGRRKKPKSMNLSTFVQVIDPDAFAGLKAFKDEMSFLYQECISNPPIDKNNKVRMPGQQALLKRIKSINEGFNLSQETVSALKDISKKFDIIL